MPVFRVRKTSGYAVISNNVFNDPRLSFRALGVLSYLLSKPDNWEVNAADLKASHSEGRDAIRTVLQELSKAGYITRAPIKGGYGGLTGTQYEVRETPTHMEAWETDADHHTDMRNTADGFPGAVMPLGWETAANGRPDVGNTADGFTGAGFPGALLKTELPNTEEREVENEETGGSHTHNAGIVRQSRTQPAVIAPKQTVYSTEFEVWWMAYGRKGNKVAAWKRWKEGAVAVPIEDVVDGTKRYLAFLLEDGRKRQDAERWLHDRGWESKWEADVPPAPVSQRNGRQPKTFMAMRQEEDVAALARVRAAVEEQERHEVSGLRGGDAQTVQRLRSGDQRPADGDLLGAPAEQHRARIVREGGGHDH